MRKKHTFEERLLAVQRYLSGDYAKQIEKDLGLGEHYIPIYVAKYKAFGEQGLRKQLNIRPTYMLKLQIVQEYTEHSLSLAEIIVKYGVSRSSVQKWVHIANTQGSDALSQVKLRGCPPKDMSKQSKPKKPLTELEQLQSEVRYLRAENDLLKKVKALVEKREAQKLATGRKSSKN